MIVVFASAADAESGPAFEGSKDVAVIRPADLSRSGWRWQSPGERISVPLPGGAVLHRSDLTGVLTRLRRVRAADLVHVHEDDREYVAAEMTAFLAALLAGLEVPVVNRGDAACLCGPHWTPQHWRRCAARLGHPVCTCAEPKTAELTVIGRASVLHEGRPVTDAAAEHARALALAGIAGVDLLEVTVCTAEQAFVAANVLPRLTPDVTASVLALLRRA